MYVLIDNYDSFTYNIFQELSLLTDERIGVYRNDDISVEEVEKLAPQGIILSPGPGHPEEAGLNIELIHRFAGRIPILGVCLGHQAIAAAFGARIVGAKKISHGKVDRIRSDGKGLFRRVPAEAGFTRYHSLVVEEESLPDCFEISARSSDGEIMGLRHRSFDIEGVQFHPESISSEYGRRVLENFLRYRRRAVNIPALLQRLLSGEDLSLQEAGDFMDELTDGALLDSQIAAFLIALNMKGITAEEIAGCATVLRKKQRSLLMDRPSVDTCGTGGDGLHTFNISSLTALTAACGLVAAKHGNRAVSSSSGSADFYRELGIPIELPADQLVRLIDRTGFGFLYAPLYHRAMRHAAPVRRQLGVKTIMNLLGPLLNPAKAEYQLIGVFDRNYCRIVAEAAKLMGAKRVMVVHGGQGEDELSITSPSHAVFIDEHDRLKEFIIDPRELGIGGYGIEDLRGGSPKENAMTAEELLSGDVSETVESSRRHGALLEAVALNTGAVLFVAGRSPDINAGYYEAKEALLTGRVGVKIEEIRRCSEELTTPVANGETITAGEHAR